MPNHVTNELTASREVVASLRGPQSVVDFNTVIPMPEILSGESSNPTVEDWAKIALGVITVQSLQVFPEDPVRAFHDGDYGKAADALHQATIVRMLLSGPFPRDFSDDQFELLIRYMRAIKQTGHASWHSWSHENWGTKWNAYEAEQVNETKVRFQTAWNTPMPVIAALSKKFPKEFVWLKWADEDWGNNTGSLVLLNGECFSGYTIENGSAEAKAIAESLLGPRDS